MVNKGWLAAMGDRTEDPQDPDLLLKDKISEKKRKEIQRQEEIEELDHIAKKAELEKKAKVASADTEKVEKTSNDTGFKVMGGVNLGTIDLQAEREKANSELEKLRLQAEQTSQTVGKENKELRDEIHKQEMKVMEISLQSQLQKMQEMIISVNSNKRSFMEEYTEAIQMAEQLGFNRTSNIQTTDIKNSIELKKLEFEQKLALDKLQQDRIEADHKWEMEKIKMEEEREARRAETDRLKKRDELFAQAPIVIGQSLAQGVMEANINKQAAANPVNTGKRGKAVQTGYGVSGEVDCPECGEPIAIGPTAKTAVCANCELTLPIRRVQQSEEDEE